MPIPVTWSCLKILSVPAVKNTVSSFWLNEKGFIDFLSWKVLGISRDEDYLVLNSVALLERSFSYLDHYGKIRCYLDNDDAGAQAYRERRDRGNPL